MQRHKAVTIKHFLSPMFLASERSERDNLRGNTIENQGYLFVGLQRDSIRGG